MTQPSLTPASTLTVGTAILRGSGKGHEGDLSSPWAVVLSFPSIQTLSFLRRSAGLHPQPLILQIWGCARERALPQASGDAEAAGPVHPTLRTAAPVGESGFCSRTKGTRSPGWHPTGIQVQLLFQPQDPGQILPQK